MVRFYSHSLYRKCKPYKTTFLTNTPGVDYLFHAHFKIELYNTKNTRNSYISRSIVYYVSALNKAYVHQFIILLEVKVGLGRAHVYVSRCLQERPGCVQLT